MIPQNRLRELGLALPSTPAPRGDYVPVVVHAGIAYVAGQVSREGDAVIAGPVGAATPPDVIARAARACVLRSLAVLHEAVRLEQVHRILQVRGFVWAEPGFTGHAQVMDAVSGLLREVFGEAGRHARSSVGVAGLPGGAMLEIEVVAAIGRPPSGDAA